MILDTKLEVIKPDISWYLFIKSPYTLSAFIEWANDFCLTYTFSSDHPIELYNDDLLDFYILPEHPHLKIRYARILNESTKTLISLTFKKLPFGITPRFNGRMFYFSAYDTET